MHKKQKVSLTVSFLLLWIILFGLYRFRREK